MKTIKLNLKKLKAEIYITKSGEKYIKIPFYSQFMFEGKKGIYLDLMMFESSNEFSDGFIKPSFNSEAFAKLSDKQKLNIPIVGNFKDFNKEQNKNQEQKNETDNFNPNGDLPF